MRYKTFWGLNRAFQGRNGGKGRGEVNLHAPEHQYIVARCPVTIIKPGESQWGLQGSQMRPQKGGQLGATQNFRWLLTSDRRAQALFGECV